MIYLSTFEPFNFNYTWSIVLQFTIICVLLLIGNTIRRKVPFFRKTLIPTAILAGFLGLGLKYLFGPDAMNVQIDGVLLLQNEFFEAITYHGIGIGFAALALKTTRESAKKNKDARALKSGILIVQTYLLQAFIGLAITIPIFYIFNYIAQYSGILLAFGFGQGPGQAGNNGWIFETSDTMPFIGGKSFGLAIATIGTMWSCIVGVWHINKEHKKKKVVRTADEERASNTQVEYADEIPLTEAVDKLSIQVALVGLVYVLAYFFIFGITKIVPKEFGALFWGFNFIFAMLIGMLVKMIIKFFKKKRWMKREYTNEYMLNRIAGVTFDFMIICSIMSVEIEMISSLGMIITLVIITTLGGIVTYIYLRKMCKILYPSYEEEAFAAMFGMQTGMAPNGIALVREIDPNYKTPAADNLVTGSATAVPFGVFLIVLIVPLIHTTQTMIFVCFAIITVVMIGYHFLMLAINRKKPDAYVRVNDEINNVKEEDIGEEIR